MSDLIKIHHEQIGSTNYYYNTVDIGTSTSAPTTATANINQLNFSSSYKKTGIFPIGSIYMTMGEYNPATYFGGTWVRFAEGRVIVGVDENQTASPAYYEAEIEGGENEVALDNVAYLPSHSHQLSNNTNTAHSGDAVYRSTYTSNNSQAGSLYSNYVGNGTEHNNMMPYITCRMWKRTA